MYTLAGLVGSAAVSAAAAVLAYYTAGMILARRPAKPEPEPEPVKKEEPKLSPEVQAIIDDGKRAMKEMGRLIPPSRAAMCAGASMNSCAFRTK